jgi:GAF domain-containing protein
VVESQESRSARAPRRGASLGGRVALVRDLAEKLTGLVDAGQVGTVVRDELRRGFGISAVVLSVLSDDGSTLSSLVTHGVAKSTKALVKNPLPLRDAVAAVAALERGRPVLWPSIAARDREFPELARHRSTSQSWAVLPLISQGKAIGTLSLGWAEPRRFGRVETAFLELVAHECALALDRARIERARRAERETLELLSEGTRLMVSALEPQAVLEALLHLAVPRLAPWCAVYVADGPLLRRQAVEIDGDPELAATLRDTEVPTGAESPIALTYATGIGRVLHPISADVVRVTYPEPFASRILRHGTEWTGLVVPVRALGSVIGVMSLVSPGWGPTPPDQVVFAAEGLAARAGVALTNARRYQDERETAAMLMEAFLPAKLPEIPGYDLAARYLPAGGRVAGDWYDVAQLADDRFLIGIGDAGGHGIRAASLMGQLRNTARGLAMTGHSPVAVIEALQLVTEGDGGTSFATATYGLFDHARHVVQWATAGHLPPLEYEEGAARFVDFAPSPPLGWPEGPIAQWSTRLKRGQGVVLFTDGLVERRDADIDAGLDALRDLVASSARLSADRLSARIAEELAAGAQDDCCAVVLRRR